MFDACVVGSGPGGVFAAYGLRGLRVLMLDAGIEPPASPPPLDDNLHALRRSGKDKHVLGEEPSLEGLDHIFRPAPSLKLKAPRTRFVISDSHRLSPVDSSSFVPAISHARGGLANAWGAGVYRFTAADMEGFPFDASELTPYYDRVAGEIGISGSALDDLTQEFGTEPGLQPPVRLSPNSARLLSNYTARRREFQETGIRLGRARLAVLTEPFRNRTAYQYRNLEFFETRDPAVYNPVFTLDQLIAAGAVTYEAGWLVTSYSETDLGVDIEARSLDGSITRTFQARKLLLAAGAINSARIALASNHDYDTRLPLCDNPIAVIPLLHWNQIGSAPDLADSAIAQLNLMVERGGERYQGSIYGSSGSLRSDLLAGFPLPMRSSLALARALAPALNFLMLFYPERRRPSNYLQLQPSGSLRIEYSWEPDKEFERGLCRTLRKLGVVCSPRLIRHPPPGGGIHYASTLPMSANPSTRYETHADGRIAGTRHVYACDGAVFPALPARNLTYTLMALALRTASLLKDAQ